MRRIWPPRFEPTWGGLFFGFQKLGATAKDVGKNLQAFSKGLSTLDTLLKGSWATFAVVTPKPELFITHALLADIQKSMFLTAGYGTRSFRNERTLTADEEAALVELQEKVQAVEIRVTGLPDQVKPRPGSKWAIFDEQVSVAISPLSFTINYVQGTSEEE